MDKHVPSFAQASDGSLAERRLTKILGQAGCTVTLVDGAGVVTAVPGNPGGTLGFAPEVLAGIPIADLLHPDDRERFEADSARCLASPGLLVSGRFRARGADGEWHMLDVTASNALEDPDLGAVVVTTRNVTGVWRAEQFAKAENDVLLMIARGRPAEEVFDTLCSALAVFNGPGVVLPSTVEELAAYEGGSVAGSGSDSPGSTAGAQPATGGVVPVRGLDAAALLADLALSRDSAAAVLRSRAETDLLTGLLNRIGFCDALTETAFGLSRDPAASSALLLFNLDRFKLVNDTMGHRAGDELLVQAAVRLRRSIRESDLAARFGADDFAVAVRGLDADPDVAQAESARVANRVVAAMAEPFPLSGGFARTGASVGVSLASGDTVFWDPEEWIHDADLAVWAAKSQGRSRVVMSDEGLRARHLHRRSVGRALHRALADDEFDMVYQPLVDLRSGEVVGAEALLRWFDGDRVRLPAEFLAIAEEAGMMVSLSRRTLCRAAETAAGWGSSLSAPFVAVNLSATQVTDDRLVDTLFESLAEAGLPPSRLVVEVTEHVVFSDLDVTVAALRRLRDAGVRVAIDDFGKGWSSLHLLGVLPFDIVKVDRAFTAGLGRDPVADVLCLKIVDLAHSLGKSVIAEGVETAEQAEAVSGLGCEFGQGWFFGFPVPAEEFSAAHVS